MIENDEIGSEFDDRLDQSTEWFMESLSSGVFDTMLKPPVWGEPEEDIEAALQRDHEAYIEALDSGALDWMMYET